MIAYIDTSALAKCYVREAHSYEVLDWMETQTDVLTGALTVVEFRCMLARRRRAGQIDLSFERQAQNAFDRDVQGAIWRLRDMSTQAYQQARQLIDQVSELPLRALDALHLATAREHAADTFATADRNQAEAARALGMTVFTFY